MNMITIDELALWRRAGFSFTLLDVRREQARLSDGSEIAGATWLDPALWLDWKDRIAQDRPVVLVCAHGHEISQGLAAALRAMGADARSLAGGMSGWRATGQPVTPLEECAS